MSYKEFDLYDYECVQRYKFLPKLSPILNLLVFISIPITLVAYIVMVMVFKRYDFIYGTVICSCVLSVLVCLFFLTMKYDTCISVPVRIRFSNDTLNIFYPECYKYNTGKLTCNESYTVKYSDIKSVEYDNEYCLVINCKSFIKESYKLTKSGNVLYFKNNNELHRYSPIIMFLGDYSDIESCASLISYMKKTISIDIRHV